VQQDAKVLIRWTIQAGNTCEDTHIERSADGISWERIGLIGGICGSPDQSVTYDFYDPLPLRNQVNHYRLELGFYGYSSPVQAEFLALPASGYLIMPHPVVSRSTLIFGNIEKHGYVFSLFDMTGKKVMELTATGNRIILDKQTLGSGMYLFRLQGNQGSLTGKVIVE